MSEAKLNSADLRKKPRKGDGSTSVSWNDGDGIAIFDGATGVPGDAEIRSLIEHVGRNPDDYHWEVVSVSWNSSGWQRDKEDLREKHTAYTGATCVVKIKIEQIKDSALIRETEEDIAALCKLVEKRKVGRTPLKEGERAFLWLWSDLQSGKGEGGGSPALVVRMGAALERVVARLKELEKVGKGPDCVYIVGMGDLIESCEGHYAMQAFQVDLDRRQQCRLVRRLLLEAVNTLTDLGYEIVLAAVPGNHGENRNSDGKAFTNWSDNDDVAIFEQVGEILAANPSRYSNVKIPVGALDREDLVVTLDIFGVPCAFAHGHQFKQGANSQAKAETWWQKQVLGKQPVTGSDILFSAHFHHFAASAATGRTWFQCPSIDGGSNWITFTSGVNSPANLLTMCISDIYPSGWGDLEIV